MLDMVRVIQDWALEMLIKTPVDNLLMVGVLRSHVCRAD